MRVNPEGFEGFGQQNDAQFCCHAAGNTIADFDHVPYHRICGFTCP